MWTTIIGAVLPFALTIAETFLRRRLQKNKITEDTWKRFLDFKKSIEKDLNDASKLRESIKDQLKDLKQ
jgi:hypothetical protein